MKAQPLLQRFRFAASGLLHAARYERSFRVHLVAAACVGGLLVWLRPPLLWQALVVVMVALVLAAELVNTAIENILDGLHPEQARFVRDAKDCAAGAVLVLSIAAVLLLVFLLMDTFLSP